MQSTSRKTSTSAPASMAARAPALRAAPGAGPRAAGTRSTVRTSRMLLAGHRGRCRGRPSPRRRRGRRAASGGAVPIPGRAGARGARARWSRRRCAARLTTDTAPGSPTVRRWAAASAAPVRWTTAPSRPRRAPGRARSRPGQALGARPASRPTAMPQASIWPAVAACSSKGRGWAMTTAGRRAAATSATAFCPAWVTTTSACWSSSQRGVPDGLPGDRSTQVHDGVAARPPRARPRSWCGRRHPRAPAPCRPVRTAGAAAADRGRGGRTSRCRRRTHVLSVHSRGQSRSCEPRGQGASRASAVS